jgi:AcrR family transcriptional regulator
MLLRPKHLKAIELLASSDLSTADVAAEVGVSLRTLQRWLKDPDFRSEFARGRGSLPYSFDGLVARTSRLLLIDIVRRLEVGEEKLPIKEVTALLAQLTAARDLPAAAISSPGDSTEMGGGPFEVLTPEQSDEIWDKFDEFVTRNQKAADPRPPAPVALEPAPSAPPPDSLDQSRSDLPSPSGRGVG